jgi:hypothetical protein
LEDPLRWAVRPQRVAAARPGEVELQVLRLCDGLRDAPAIAEAAGLRTPAVRRILARMAKRGVLARLPAARGRSHVPESLIAWAHGQTEDPTEEPDPPEAEFEPRFTGDEESFFSTRLPDELEWDPEES